MGTQSICAPWMGWRLPGWHMRLSGLPLMAQFLREILGSIYAPVVIPAVRIGWILLIAYLILKILDSGLTRLRLLIPSSDVIGGARGEQRTDTLRHIIRSVSRTVLILLVLLTISSEFGFNIGPVLASAGIVG